MNRIEHMEDYTNAVIAIVITLMVLDIHAPNGSTAMALHNANNHIFTYIYSFLLISMYWINHGRIFQNFEHIHMTTRILWANNLFLLFITFIPFATSWLAHYLTYRLPEMSYAFIILCVDLSYYLLLQSVLHTNPQLKRETKFKIYRRKLHGNLLINIIAIICGYFEPLTTIGISLCAIVLWMVPDRLFEHFHHV